MSGVRIGIAVGADAVTAVAPLGKVVHSTTIPLGPNGDRGALLAAFEATKAALDRAIGASTDGASVSVAVLPPIADARLVTLPPLRSSEAEAVLQRDAARHFLGGAGTRVVAVEKARSAGQPRFAVAAPASLLEAIRSAVTESGWGLASIVPAVDAWRAAADEIAPNDDPRLIAAVLGDTIHMVRLEAGRIESIRRLSSTALGEVAVAGGADPGRAIVFAAGDDRKAIGDALARAGWSIAPSGAEVPAAIAAALNAEHARLELVPPALASDRRARARVHAKRLIAGAVGLVVISAAIGLWGAKREVDSIADARAAIRAEVAPLLATGDSLSRMAERIALVQRLEAGAAPVTRALVDIARLLPDDTYLTSLEAKADRVIIDASGGSAGSAIQALRGATTLADVRLVGTVDREIEDGETTAEKFRLAARLVGAAPSTDPAAKAKTTARLAGGQR